MTAGQPTLYNPKYCNKARELCEAGATDQELADYFGVTRTSIWRWKSEHQEFCNALKVGKEAADERVERSLYHKAIGYSFDSEKVFQFQGEIVRTPTREHVPPDTTAAIFWLKNRRRDEWRDRQDHEHTGKDGGAIEMIVTDRQRARALAAFVAKAKAKPTP